MAERSPEKRSKGPGHGGPARGYSWEPFERGNTAAMTHGARSPARVEPLAAELAEAAFEAVGYLDAPEFRSAVFAWARAEASVRLLFDHVQEHGLIGENGKPTVSLDWLLRFERLAAQQRSVLGLDPVSRAKLEKDLAALTVTRFDIDALAAEGRRALEGRKDGKG